MSCLFCFSLGSSSEPTVRPTTKGSTAAYVTSEDGQIKDMLFNMLPRGGYLVSAIDDLNSCDLVCSRSVIAVLFCDQYRRN